MSITPDTKDWTWVLERPCPECTFAARDVTATDVAPMVRANAMRWAEQLTHPDASVRARDDLWSILEYACHVRDVFEIFDHRLGRMLNEDGPHFENWDQDATAIERAYAQQAPESVASQLTIEAELVARRLEHADAQAAWSRTGFRSDGAAFTIASIARYMIHDPIHHLVDIGLGPRDAGVPT